MKSPGGCSGQHAEAILELLEDLGHVSEALHDCIMEEKDLGKRKTYTHSVLA